LLTAAWVQVSFGGLERFAYIAGYIVSVGVVSVLTNAESRHKNSMILTPPE
jgi:hypothetical protein